MARVRDVDGTTNGHPNGHRNEVTVAGRLSAAAMSRQLPSGDEIVTWRMIIERAPSSAPRNFDLVDCTAFKARVRRQAMAWEKGDVIEITGALRRRFWRGPAGLQSKCEVEVETAARRTGNRVRQPATSAGLTRPRKPG